MFSNVFVVRATTAFTLAIPAYLGMYSIFCSGFTGVLVTEARTNRCFFQEFEKRADARRRAAEKCVTEKSLGLDAWCFIGHR